jgi:energy-coupling factor transporter ATP-binding protein EcfA2
MKKSALNLILGVSCLGWLGAAGWSAMPRDYLFTEASQVREVDVSVNDHGKSAILQPRSYNNPAITFAFLAMAGLSGVALAKSLEAENPAKVEEAPVVPHTQQQVATPIVIRNTNVQRTSAPRPQPVAVSKTPLKLDEEIYEDDEPIAVTEYSKGVFTGDIIGEIIRTSLHILIATKSGAGKSTTLKALIHRLMTDKPGATFNIVDPKTTDWFGLQRTTDVVTYLGSGTSSEQLDTAIEAINKTSEKLKQRKKAMQSALKSGANKPKFAQHYLVLDEWYKVLADIKRLKREDEFSEPLGEIVSMGRELGIQLILVSVSHLCKEIGFSGPVRECFSVLAQGRVGENNDVGYAPITRALNDAYLFQDRQQSGLLQQQLAQAIAMAKKQGDRPVLLTTMGIPKIALMPDLKHLDGFRFDSEKSEESDEPMEDSMDELDRILAIGKDNVVPLFKVG